MAYRRPVPEVPLLLPALLAPASTLDGQDLYPTFEEKAAVLCARLAQNHPLPDGNKRLAWMCLRNFCELNGRCLTATADDAVAAMLAVASGDWDVPELADWVRDHLREKA